MISYNPKNGLLTFFAFTADTVIQLAPSSPGKNDESVNASLEIIAEEIGDPCGGDANDAPTEKLSENIQRGSCRYHLINVKNKPGWQLAAGLFRLEFVLRFLHKKMALNENQMYRYCIISLFIRCLVL